MSESRPEKLQALRSHLDHWYADFDWQAMEVALCAILTHYAAKDTQPIWPFIVGAPRTGKTEVIRALEGLPKAESLSDVTPAALFSGHKDAKGGLLNQLAEADKSILLFKDFTTILSKHEDARNEVVGILREVADGDFHRWTGLGRVCPWKGRMTIVAAVTDEIERMWSVMQTLGPRFLFIRWPTPDRYRTSQMARAQINLEKSIHKETQRLVRDIFYASGDLYLPAMNQAHGSSLDTLCSVFVQLRQQVEWHRFRKDIVDVRGMEGTGSIAKHTDLICRTRAGLYGREVPNREDLDLAIRVALDTCAPERVAIVRHLAKAVEATQADLAKIIGKHRNTIAHHIDELEALLLVEVERIDGMPSVVSLSPDFHRELTTIFALSS